MKIFLTGNVLVKGSVIGVGEHEVSDELGQSLIDRKVARAVNTKTAPEPVQKPPRSKKDK